MTAVCSCRYPKQFASSRLYSLIFNTGWRTIMSDLELSLSSYQVEPLWSSLLPNQVNPTRRHVHCFSIFPAPCTLVFQHCLAAIRRTAVAVQNERLTVVPRLRSGVGQSCSQSSSILNTLTAAASMHRVAVYSLGTTLPSYVQSAFHLLQTPLRPHMSPHSTPHICQTLHSPHPWSAPNPVQYSRSC